ncbi:MAG: alpha/beta hydrolase [Nitrospirae bacterium]|nr:alpha/beta hydrolase [Nitrospirota bacterium]
MEKEIDVDFVEGKGPMFIFVHGLGLDKNVWITPEKSMVLAGCYPISVMLAKPPPDRVVEKDEPVEPLTSGIGPNRLSTLFHDLSERGFSCLAFNQRRPANVIAYAIDDIMELIGKFTDYTRSGVFLVGHSRGGVIARTYAETYGGVLGFITLSSPHGGSNLAKWAKSVSRFTSVVLPLMNNTEKGTLMHGTKRLLTYIGSNAVEELLPESSFIASLSRVKPGDMFAMSAGCSKAGLFTIYRAKKTPDAVREGFSSVTYKKLLSVPESLLPFIPDNIIPEELLDSLGDGMVSVKSSRIPYADVHLVYPLNHVEVLFDQSVRSDALNALRDNKII